MKIILISLMTFMSLSFTHINSAYVEKMQSTLREMGSCKTKEDFKKIHNTFERISKAEPAEWLPLYYMANIHISLAYLDTTATIAQKDQYLDYAETIVIRMEKLNPEDAEIEVLKAWLAITRLGLDPQTRAMNVYPLYVEALNKAVSFGPENPRVKFMVLSKEMGEATFYGQSTESACGKLTNLLDTWDNHSVKSEIHPQWGKPQLADMVKGCKGGEQSGHK